VKPARQHACLLLGYYCLFTFRGCSTASGPSPLLSAGWLVSQALEHTPEVFGSVEMLYVDMEVRVSCGVRSVCLPSVVVCTRMQQASAQRAAYPR
jgi:hypothetical protein